MKRKERIHYYRAADGWRWRLRARNGLILADSGQGYARKDAATRGARLALSALSAVLEAS